MSVLSKLSELTRRHDRPRQGRDHLNRHSQRTLRFEVVEPRLLLAGVPQLVKDIGLATPDSYPDQLVTIGNTTYFIANDGYIGWELWKSDGTEAGTVLIKDVVADNTIDGHPHAERITNAGGTLYFSIQILSNTGFGAWQLWKSDGTEEGTVMVKDFIEGNLPDQFVAAGDMVFFTVNYGPAGPQLWKTDGTEAGTMVVQQLEAYVLTDLNGTLYFRKSNFSSEPTDDLGLWKSDGTPDGTVRVHEVEPNGLSNIGGTLFFSGNDDINGWELWKSDGTTAGTMMVRDLLPGTGSYSYPLSGSPEIFTDVNGTLFFIANDGSNRWNALWKSDGTTAGTVLVKDFNNNKYGSISSLTQSAGSLFFTIDSAQSGRQLWKSNGTSAGTILVKSGIFGLYDLTDANGTLFFTARDETNGGELWKSDGTTAGTVLVEDLVPGPAGSYPFNLTGNNGKVLFTADDPMLGLELFQSDGTAAGTGLVKDINARNLGSNPSAVVESGGTAFFGADGKLWITNGTEAATTALKDVGAVNLTDVDGMLFFTGIESNAGVELWKSDGTAAGTVLVKDIDSQFNSFPSSLTNVGGTLFFSADNGSKGRELWKSDGTSSGTVLVKDVYPGSTHVDFRGYKYTIPNSSSPAWFTDLNGTLFFTAYDGTNGRELWKSNGTAGGTVLVKDIVPGGAYPSTDPRYLTNVGGTLFFTANDGVNGRELWKSDGTAAGTLLVRDILPGGPYSGSYPRNLTNVGGTLFFVAQDGTNGNELWKSDGTPEGTMLVKDIAPGANGSEPSNLTEVAGVLFFSAINPSGVIELWTSDGTDEGTVLVKENVGVAGTPPTNFINAGGILFFTADDGIHGRELWQSDGTAAGTLMVGDINLGAASSFPTAMSHVGGTLYFSADDGVHGRELWVLDLTAPPPLAGDHNGDGRVDAADYVLWRKLGLPQSEYDTWRANFGQSAATQESLAIATIQAPAPTTISAAASVDEFRLSDDHSTDSSSEIRATAFLHSVAVESVPAPPLRNAGHTLPLAARTAERLAARDLLFAYLATMRQSDWRAHKGPLEYGTSHNRSSPVALETGLDQPEQLDVAFTMLGNSQRMSKRTTGG